MRTSYKFFLLALATLVASFQTTCCGDVIYDIADDYNLAQNPNGVWTYASSVSVGGTIEAMTGTNEGGVSGGENVQQWHFGNSPVTGPTTTYNPNNFGFDNSVGIAIDPFGVDLGPSSSRYNVVRFQAPESSVHILDIEVFGMEFSTGTTSDVHILIDNISVFSGAIDGWVGRDFIATPRFGPSPDLAFESTRSLGSGSTVDLYIGDGGNGQSNDQVGIRFSVTAIPEPNLMVLWVFASVAACCRRVRV